MHRCLLFYDFFDFLHRFISDDPLAAVVAVECRNRHAPGSLAGNTPVLTVADHVVETVMAPGWDEACIVDSFQCFISEVVDGCEPLLGSTIDDWVLAAPAVCVLMVDGFLAKEVAFMSQSGDDRAFCVPDALALEEFACFSSHVAFSSTGQTTSCFSLPAFHKICKLQSLQRRVQERYERSLCRHQG